MSTFIRNINTGSYIARCANHIPTGTHVIYANKDGELRDGVTHNTSVHKKFDGLPVFTRDKNGVYR